MQKQHHCVDVALRKAWGIEGRCVIQTGNYPGHVLDEAARMGFRRGLFCAHPGKLLKVAAGSFNTHNRVADGRLEALCTQAALAGADRAVVRRLYECRTTENAMELLREERLEFLWNPLAEVVARRCTDRSFGIAKIAGGNICPKATTTIRWGANFSKTGIKSADFILSG